MRYGIIGCGSMGREHIENIRALGGGAKVTAIADPHAPSREAALALGEGIVAFERTDQLLNSGLVDVLVHRRIPALLSRAEEDVLAPHVDGADVDLTAERLDARGDGRAQRGPLAVGEERRVGRELFADGP